MSTTFWRIHGSPFTPWGDYGDILQHGMTSHLERTGGLLSLERTGPYIPPITFPGIDDIVVNAAARRLLESSGLTGFDFRPVHKALIVNLNWEDWDITADDPPEYPKSGEPEDYILERPHDAVIARQMGDVWELVIPMAAVVGRSSPKWSPSVEFWVEVSSWTGADLFRGEGLRAVLASEHARLWLEEHLGEFVSFEEFKSK
jgi:hypothetical protein